ncbi:MAG: hypothetical protein ACM3MI_04385 [Clostridiales bacterium]
MRFSENFNITVRESEIDWFDPLLTIDTKLFVDPFLIYADEDNEFKGSHQEIITFFNAVFQLIARSKGNTTNPFWIKAEGLLLFPEAHELCLGYASVGTKGSGSSHGFAKVIAGALWEAVQAGVKEITHFEEVGILREGIGADRISDITATLLKHKFVLYTRKICECYNIPLERKSYKRGVYNNEFQMWMPLETCLPINPLTQTPIILTPRKYLRDLPTISSDDFWNYCYHNENIILRNDYGLDITSHVDKKTIIEFAVKHPEIRDNYISVVEHNLPDPYDFSKDKRGLIKWYDVTGEYCSTHQFNSAITSGAEFVMVLKEIIQEFANYVENNEGWRLLWNEDNTTRSEEAAQLLFLGIVKHYCKANNIDISREVNIGRGPVDFKVSQGYEIRALLELKLVKNSKFWNGLKAQLPKYLEAESIDVGFFIVIAFTDKDFKKINNILPIADSINKRTGLKLEPLIIDARPNPISASKIK